MTQKDTDQSAETQAAETVSEDKARKKPPTRSTDREAALAQALRQNLRRRKEAD